MAPLLTAVIVAGGAGKRMGQSIPKQFLPLNGVPILVRTLEQFLRYQETLQIVLVLPKNQMEQWEFIAQRFIRPTDLTRITIAEGGDSRTVSVFNGLSRLKQSVAEPTSTWVAIHDGVRPFAHATLLENAYQLAQEKGASVVCVPVKSSLRRRQEGGSNAVDRSQYVEVQTPQTFRLDKIWEAFMARPHDQYTDDASLYEALVGPVAIGEGSYDNLKITTPEDLSIAEQTLLRHKPEAEDIGKRREQIKLIVLDVDNTLTDGYLYYHESGEEIKKFHVHDGLAIRRMIRKYQMQFGFISSGSTPGMVQKFADELGVQRTFSGPKAKIQILDKWLQELGLGYEAVAYVGDDLNDIGVIRQVGVSACPANAAHQIQAEVDMVLTRNGGEACVREFIESALQYEIG